MRTRTRASERVLDHFHTWLRLRAFGNNLIQTVTMPVTTLLKSLLFRVNRCPKRSKAAPKAQHFGRCFRQFWLAGPTRVGTSASPEAPGELQKAPRRSSRGTRRVPEGTQSITLNKVMVLIPKRSLIVAKKLRDPGLTEM